MLNMVNISIKNMVLDLMNAETFRYLIVAGLVITFGVDMSSFGHVNKRKKDNIITILDYMDKSMIFQSIMTVLMWLIFWTFINI